MKKSTVAKGALIGTTVTVAALCPLAGAVAGGYLVVTAAASMSTGATIALGAAGVVGGGVVGSAVGGIVSLPVKIWALSKAAKKVKKVMSEDNMTINGVPFKGADLKPVFDKALKDLDKKGGKPTLGPDLKNPKL